MREKLKERNLKILTLYHEKSSLENKLKKTKILEIAEELREKSTTVKRVIDTYYEKFVKEICTKNTEIGDLTEFKKKIKFENLTEKQGKFLIGKLFGLSDTKALEKAGYKSKGSLRGLKSHNDIREYINNARLETLKKTKYTFEYNYEFLGKISEEGKNGYDDKEIFEKYENGVPVEQTKKITRRKNLSAAIMAIRAQNQMMGYEDMSGNKAEEQKEKIQMKLKKR